MSAFALGVTPRKVARTVMLWAAALVPFVSGNVSAAAATNALPAEAMDPVSKELFENYLVHAFKISSDDVQAAIQLVASRSAGHIEAEDVIMSTLERADNKTVQRNLIAVITKILAKDGAMRWQRELEARTGETGQAATAFQRRGQSGANAADSDAPLRGLLDRVLALGRNADRANIDDFVMALRQSHHPAGKEFLLDVLRNPETGITDGKWSDNIGGTWRDAKFHAAIALAELGDPAGIQWLIAQTDDRFGHGGEVSRAPHVGPAMKSLRNCCVHALSELSGQPATLTQSEWQHWWSNNQSEFVPQRRVSLLVR